MAPKPSTVRLSEKKPWDSTFQMMSWWDTEKIAAAKVMVVGAGALGNEVLKNLALLGIGHIYIVDFDTIEFHNLNRSILFREQDCDRLKAEVAAERIKDINPNVKVFYSTGDISIDIGLGVFRQMDVIIGCLDNRVARLRINQHCFKVGKVWIDGAIQDLIGQVDVFKRGLSCYECQLTELEKANIKFRWGCPDVAKRNAMLGQKSTTPISASIVAAMQVQEALKIIFGYEEKSLAGQRFKYEGMNNFMLLYPFPELKQYCFSHSFFDPIIEMPELSSQSTITHLLTKLEEHLGATNIEVLLLDNIVLEIDSEHLPDKVPQCKVRGHFSDEYLKPYRQHNEEIYFSKMTDKITRDFPYPGATLAEIGLPALEVFRVSTSEGLFFVELSGDQIDFK